MDVIYCQESYSPVLGTLVLSLLWAYIDARCDWVTTVYLIYPY